MCVLGLRCMLYQTAGPTPTSGDRLWHLQKARRHSGATILTTNIQIWFKAAVLVLSWVPVYYTVEVRVCIKYLHPPPCLMSAGTVFRLSAGSLAGICCSPSQWLLLLPPSSHPPLACLTQPRLLVSLNPACLSHSTPPRDLTHP